MGAQYQLVQSGELYGCMKMTRKFVQATQFSNESICKQPEDIYLDFYQDGFTQN